MNRSRCCLEADSCWRKDVRHVRQSVHCRHLANMTERSIRGGDVALCQITLTTFSSALSYTVLCIHALMLLIGQQEGHPACKKTKWWGAGVVICLERGADLHMAQLMSLPLTVSCFSKIQIGFTFLVPDHLGSPGQRAVKRVCVCVGRHHSPHHSGRRIIGLYTHVHTHV